MAKMRVGNSRVRACVGTGGDAVARMFRRWVLVVYTLQWLDKHVVGFLGECMDDGAAHMCDYEVRGEGAMHPGYKSWDSFHGSSKDGTREWVCEGSLLKDELVIQARNSVVEAGDVTMEMIVVGEVAGTMRHAGGYRVWLALRKERMQERLQEWLHTGLMWWRLTTWHE